MCSSDQIAQDALNNLIKLAGKTVRTLRKEEFIVSIRDNELFVIIQRTGKSRHVDIKKEIVPAYRYLREGNLIEGVGSGRKSIRGLGFSEANPAYVWGILNNFTGIQTENNKLFIKNG